jgi:hypothetical protein
MVCIRYISVSTLHKGDDDDDDDDDYDDDNTSTTYRESTKSRNYKQTATMGTAHILWKSTNVTGQNIQQEKQHHMWHELQTQNSFQIICPRKMVCFRYIIVNTLQKLNDDDDDDDD